MYIPRLLLTSRGTYRPSSSITSAQSSSPCLVWPATAGDLPQRHLLAERYVAGGGEVVKPTKGWGPETIVPQTTAGWSYSGSLLKGISMYHALGIRPGLEGRSKHQL